MQNTPEDVYNIDKDAPYLHVLGRKDGRQIIDYMIHVECADERLELDTIDMEEKEDGSIVWWASGSAEAELDIEAVEITVSARITVDDEPHPVDSLTFQVPKVSETKRATLTPAEEGTEQFEVVSGEITFSKLRAYLTVCYRCDPDMSDEVTIHIFDAEGNRLPEGGGEQWEQDGLCYEKLEMQSFDELPERFILGAKVIGEDRYLGRIECTVSPE